MVKKRHHTRLFARDHDDKSSVDASGNILPGNLIVCKACIHACIIIIIIFLLGMSDVKVAGTVVDSKICHPTEFDFYLCSHSGIQVNFASFKLEVNDYICSYDYESCYREQVVLLITTSYGMKTISLLMHCKALPTTCAIRK